MSRRSLFLAIVLLASLGATYLPPTTAHVRSVADRLAAEHQCPRPLPPVVRDDVQGLTSTQRCGVLAAGLALLDSLDPGGRSEDANGQPAIATTDRIWVFTEEYTTPRGARRRRVPHSGPRFEPPLSWREQAFSRRHWIFSVSRGPGGNSSMAMVWVDQSTGAAHVMDRIYR